LGLRVCAGPGENEDYNNNAYFPQLLAIDVAQPHATSYNNVLAIRLSGFTSFDIVRCGATGLLMNEPSKM